MSDTKKEFYGLTSGADIIRSIWAMRGDQLDYAVRDYIDNTAVHPSRSLAETWALGEKHSSENWHRFNLHCDAGVWESEFSTIYSGSGTNSPQEAILQALLVDVFDIVYDPDANDWKFREALNSTETPATSDQAPSQP